MNEKKKYEIFISIDNIGERKFMFLDPYIQRCYITDNIYHMYEEVTKRKEEDNGKSDFEFYDGVDLLFIEIAKVEVFSFNLLSDWQPEPEDKAPLN